jgi:N-acetylglucosaminyl-diphospho-decaprenol L-rhamnosyltransferase
VTREKTRDGSLVSREWPTIVGNPDLTVIVVNYNTAHLLDRMISALESARGKLVVQLIIIDNASRDSSVSLIRCRHPEVDLIINDVNVGFGRANNQALPLIRGKFILLLNTDAFVSEETLSKTVHYMESNPRCGILGVRLVGEDGTLQPSCRYFPTPWNDFVASSGLQKIFSSTRLVDDMAWDHKSIRECDWVPGCYYLMRQALVDQIGLFDPRYFLYFEEVDHCRSARDAGWSVIFYPLTSVVHIGGESAKTEGVITRSGRQISELEIESKMLFFRKHHGRLGVITAIVLLALRVALAAFKDVVHSRRPSRLQGELDELRKTLRIAMSTKIGSKPTR